MCFAKHYSYTVPKLHDIKAQAIMRKTLVLKTKVYTYYTQNKRKFCILSESYCWYYYDVKEMIHGLELSTTKSGKTRTSASFLRAKVGYKQEKQMQLQSCCVFVLADILALSSGGPCLSLCLETGYIETFCDFLQHFQQCWLVADLPQNMSLPLLSVFFWIHYKFVVFFVQCCTNFESGSLSVNTRQITETEKNKLRIFSA
jgi:hypothetical protein